MTFRDYTTSFAFFEAIWEAGITHVFVNLGSDHPSIIEAIVKGQNEKQGNFPRIITCPNEMVALSMADGVARLTNKPQCVIVHVDVGTQGLAAAVHNASCGRAPVLIFAGLSPYTIEGEYRGSRTEYIHWIQDVPDQKQIVAQYCRYTGEIKGGRNVKQMVNRALQFATSDPQGPVYLCGAREPMEEDIQPYQLEQEVWQAISPAALPQDGVKLIAEELVKAKEPLLIVGYTGRKVESVTATVALADKIPGLRVLDTGGSDMCFPTNHPAALGLRYGSEPAITTADFILVVDCDVPWIPTQCKPKADARIIHIDVDPLKQQMPVFYIPAFARFKADSATSFTQISEYLASNETLTTVLSETAHTVGVKRQEAHTARWSQFKELAKIPSDPANSSIDPHILGGQLRASVPEDTIFAVEAVTLTGFIADQIAPVLPKSWINCGGGGLGWSGGGALGVKLASDFEHRDVDAGDLTGAKKGKFVCQIVGDGTFMFSVPSSVYWIAQRYEIPILTIVLNNKGWNAPRRSMLLVHPHGEGSKVDNKALHISFEPTPDYAGIAKAASGGHAWAGTVSTVQELLDTLPQAVAAVRDEGRSAILEVKIGVESAGKQNGEIKGKEVGATSG
ncbi:thiamine pyrophosphate enzyme [Exophiala viscosa]|uniref:Thiamine pyrophosphate enzyme n=1 Tax=Exophiala viscosa TaxID=2486360 RepID=A0AAN6DUP0_9EURO|nr:thiamine pyrophosphate enzyme [Exophiala viscosa]KAI1626198.1 thiamine pyrophosphate enzyme [Exophiala viscosa]